MLAYPLRMPPCQLKDIPNVHPPCQQRHRQPLSATIPGCPRSQWHLLRTVIIGALCDHARQREFILCHAPTIHVNCLFLDMWQGTGWSASCDAGNPCYHGVCRHAAAHPEPLCLPVLLPTSQCSNQQCRHSFGPTIVPTHRVRSNLIAPAHCCARNAGCQRPSMRRTCTPTYANVTPRLSWHLPKSLV